MHVIMTNKELIHILKKFPLDADVMIVPSMENYIEEISIVSISENQIYIRGGIEM